MKGSLLEWRSFKSKRALRSTLAPEAAASDGVVDSCQFHPAFYAIVMTRCALKEDAYHLPYICITDSKSLYDCVAQGSCNMSERRCAIDVAAIREGLQANFHRHRLLPPRLRWVPGEFQRADGLTKFTKQVRANFQQFLLNPVAKLIDDHGVKNQLQGNEI
eukprot:6475595-Amphidinium_carterae.1